MGWVRTATVLAAAGAVVAGSATGVLAAPATGPTVSVVVSESLGPVLKATATVAGSGPSSLQFYARKSGSTAWDLLNGTTIAGTTGTVRIPEGSLSTQSSFEYRAEHCDDTGCTSSATQTGQVSGDLGIGSRPGVTGIPFTLGDSIGASVDPGSGNLQVTSTQFTLPRVAGDLSVGLAYNSLSRAGASAFATSISSGWRLSTGSDVYLRREATTGAMIFNGPGGVTGTFFPISGTNTFTTPAGFKADLTAETGGGWKLADHGSGQSMFFGTNGLLSRLEDRNGNQTTFAYNYSQLTRIVADQGVMGARTLAITPVVVDEKQIAGISQAASGGESARSASYDYDADGRLVTLTDTGGRQTTFDYDAGGYLASVTAPGGAVTSFSYDGQGRVLSVTQPAAGTATAVTRFAYAATTTVVADPNTDQSQAVTAVPRTTYTLTPDGQKLISEVKDPSGNVRSASYTPFLDVETSSDTAGSSTSTFGANGGESLTGTQGQTGATSSFSYGTDASTKYLPAGSTDAQGNASTYTYNGAGNRLSSADAGNNTASVAYNPDGTVDTSTSPSGALTDYTYTSKQPTAITPPAGTSLDNRSYTYDGFGRLKTATSGRGVTETYAYDELDRITGISYSTGGTVSYTYDAAGRMILRVDPSGTTTMTYDPLGRLASRVHSSNAVLISYTYDKAGNLATVVDPGGTTTYAYNTRNLVTRMTLPNSQLIDFGYDSDGRRVDTWQGTNAAHTTWDAHSRTEYDAADQVSRVWTARANNDATRISDLTYSYVSPGPSSGGCQYAAAAGATTQLRQSMTDNITGQVTTYCYTTSNRLASATTSGGGDAFSYTYDVDGNRTQTVKNGTVVDTQSVNAADQITNPGYSYDASGNLSGSTTLGTVTYSSTEQMTKRVEGGKTTTYAYAGTNQDELLNVTTPNTGARTYTYGRNDSDGLPLIESYNAGQDGENYIAHDPSGTPIAIRAFTGQTHYYAEDGLGSTIALVNQSGAQTADYNYDPSGEVTVTNPTPTSNAQRVNPFRYAGGTYDISSNLIKFGQRWYDPETGRFTQMDSLETLADPSRANRYEYAAGNPINYVDPTGRDWGGTIGSIVGGVAAAFAAAAICAGTAGVGCVVGAAFAGGALSTAGGLIGAGLANEDVTGEDLFSWGVGGAATGGAGGLAGLVRYGRSIR